MLCNENKSRVGKWHFLLFLFVISTLSEGNSPIKTFCMSASVFVGFVIMNLRVLHEQTLGSARY